jgi:hypothetical protein
MLSNIKNISCSISLVLGSVFIISSCTGKSKKDEVIKAMEENLSKSNTTINNSTTTILKALEEKRNDPAYSETRSIEWFERAEKTAKISKGLYDFIAAAKKDIGKKEFSVIQLHDKLVLYKKEILTTDTAILEQFNNEFEFVDSFSSRSYADELLSRLSIIQNNIKLNENKIIAFCNTKVGIVGDWFFSYAAVVGQSSTYVRPGENVTITAGVGAYRKDAEPVININGKNISLEEEGFAKYKLIAHKIPGTYTIPVQIEFTDPTTRKKETKQVNLEYTVAKPCDQ